MNLSVWLFWGSAALALYATVGYPVWICAMARLRPRPVRKSSVAPIVTCVIAARDEASVIGARIGNLLSADYPSDRLDVIVVSDGSHDGTGQIVEEWAQRHPRRVTLVSSPTPQGKAHALNAGVAQARGAILLFADARQRFEPDAIRALVSNFGDPAVGAVTGQLLLEESGGGVSRGLRRYWDFETWLREMESRSGSTIGCTGAIYAIRRSLFVPLPEATLLDDVLVPVRAMLRGYRVVFEKGARAWDALSASAGHEFGRKVRTVAGNMQLLSLEPGLRNPFRSAAVWRFHAHKLLPRVLLPYCLAVLLGASLVLGGPFYRAALAVQLAIYATGLLGLILGARGRWLGVPAAFVLLNAAAVVGAARYLGGSSGTLWRGPVTQRRPDAAVGASR